MKNSLSQSCLLFLAVVSFTCADSLSVQKCMIDKSFGSVWVRSKDKGIWVSPEKAGKCDQGHSVKTGEQSQLVVTFEPSMRGTLEENTLVSFDKMLIEREKKNIRMVIHVQKGTFRIKMEPLFGYTALLTIHTPSATIDLNSAEAVITVANDSTLFDLADGTAKIRQNSSSAKSVLNSGTRATVSPNNKEISISSSTEEPGPATAGKEPKIAILSIQATDVSRDNLDKVSDYIADEMQHKSNTKVLYLEDIRAMLHSEGMESLLYCFTDSCLSKIGAAIGVDAVIMGGIGQIGNNYLFSLKMIDVLRSAIVDRENVRVSGDMSKILDEIPSMVSKIAKQSTAKQAAATPAAKPGEPPSAKAAAAAQPSPRPGEGKQAPAYRETVVWLKGGTFTMGSRAAEGEMDESPLHSVKIHSLYIDKYEVTKEDYARVMGTNPSSVKGCDRCPVDNVTWIEADQYCTKVGKRLPTEAEWEYACRAGTATQFAFGNTLSSEQANFDGRFPYGGVPSGPSHDRALPVASYAPNAWGLYDMHGNVAEWCYDWYNAAYYGNSANADPQGPNNGKLKVVRGGAFNQKAAALRSAHRAGYNPSIRLSNIGFRCVQDDTTKAQPGSDEKGK